MRLRPLLIVAAAVGCDNAPIEDMDEVYFAWDRERSVCAVGIDDHLDNSLDSIRGGLARAAERAEVVMFYAHVPGKTVSWERLDAIVEAADAAGVDFLTFRDLADDPAARRGGVALTFDDAAVDAWAEAAERYAPLGARATFFVTRFDQLSAERVDTLRRLEAEGHAIESHGRDHIDAADFVDRFGVDAYLEQEIVPALEAMREAGLSPRAHAYPFGFHTRAIDQLVLEHVDYVRSLSWSVRYPFVQDPC